MVQSPARLRMATQPGRSFSLDRLSVALRSLQKLSDDQLERVVWNRLLGRGDRMLPPLGRDESPTDLFIGVLEEFPDSEVAKRLQRLSEQLLERVVSSGAETTQVLGDLCYLAA